MDGAWGDYHEGREQAANRGGGGRAGGLGDLSIVFRCVHLALLWGRAVFGQAGGRGIALSTFEASRARGVGGGVVDPAVSTVGRGGGAAIGDGAEIALFGAGGVGAAVFCFPVVKSADRADGVVIFADRSRVAVPLTVAAAGGFIGRVSDLDLPPARQEENTGAQLFPFLGGGGNHHRGAVFEGLGVGVWVEEARGGDCKVFGVENSGFEVDK